MKSLPRFAARSSARTWLLSLARRAWVDSVRHDEARPHNVTASCEQLNSQLEATSADAPDDQPWAELVDARILIDQLPDDRREALILTQILGYSYEEAARIAGVRVGTIRSRVARARSDIIAAVGCSHG